MSADLFWRWVVYRDASSGECFPDATAIGVQVQLALRTPHSRSDCAQHSASTSNCMESNAKLGHLRLAGRNFLSEFNDLGRLVTGLLRLTLREVFFESQDSAAGAGPSDSDYDPAIRGNRFDRNRSRWPHSTHQTIDQPRAGEFKSLAPLRAARSAVLWPRFSAVNFARRSSSALRIRRIDRPTVLAARSTTSFLSAWYSC
jgi:hypothetical protein